MAPKKSKKKDPKQEEPKEEEVKPELPDGPKSWVVGSWSGIKDINDAVARAADGDLIILGLGDTFEAQGVIDKNVHVKGAGAQGGALPVVKGGLIVRADAKIAIEGVRFESPLVIEKGKHTVTACEFEGDGNLLSLWPYSDAAVSGCKFVTRSKAGVYCFAHAKGSVTKCEVKGDGPETSGIVMDNCCTAVEGNTITGTTTGIYCFCADPTADKAELNNPAVKNNTIDGCAGTGLHVDSGANGTFQGNTITNAGYWGVNVSNKATGTFTKNTVRDKVRIRAGCRPVLAQNTITARVMNENDVGTISMQERY